MLHFKRPLALDKTPLLLHTIPAECHLGLCEMNNLVISKENFIVDKRNIIIMMSMMVRINNKEITTSLFNCVTISVEEYIDRLVEDDLVAVIR